MNGRDSKKKKARLKMNKAEMVGKYSEGMGCSKVEAAAAVEMVFELIKGTVKRGKKVQISGFGTFAVAKRKARKGINPNTREEIRIPAKKKFVFKASGSFTEQLNG
jgi:DNA-binding protein HU-beta